MTDKVVFEVKDISCRACTKGPRYEGYIYVNGEVYGKKVKAYTKTTVVNNLARQLADDYALEYSGALAH